MSIVASLLLLVAGSPSVDLPVVDSFVALMKAGNLAEAKQLVNGDVALSSNLAQRQGRASIPFEEMLKVTSSCKLSSTSKYLLKGYDLDWNCGAKPDANGKMLRYMMSVYVTEDQGTVHLANFMLGHFPDTDPVLSKE